MKKAAPENTIKLLRKYVSSKRRLLLLDYDGTLTGFADEPEQAIPSEQTIEVLKLLSSDSRNNIVIVSGRDHSFLERWFKIENICLISEHGVGIRANNSSWEFKLSKADWKRTIRQLVEPFCERTSGSFIEDKPHSIVWHFRKSESAIASEMVSELLRLFNQTMKQEKLEAIEGHQIVEFKEAGISKGISVKEFMSNERYDFIMAIGDDKTDEDMFEVLPKQSYTIKVGEGRTAANFRIDHADNVNELLRRLSVVGQFT